MSSIWKLRDHPGRQEVIAFLDKSQNDLKDEIFKVDPDLSTILFSKKDLSVIVYRWIDVIKNLPENSIDEVDTETPDLDIENITKQLMDDADRYVNQNIKRQAD